MSGANANTMKNLRMHWHVATFVPDGKITYEVRNSESVSQAGTRIDAGAALHDGAFHRLVGKAALVDAGEQDPAWREVVGTKGAEARGEKPALVHIVVRLEGLLANPCRLPVQAGEKAMTAIEADIGARVELHSAIAVQMLAQAQEAVHRHDADAAIGFDMQAHRSIRIVVSRARFVCELRTDVEPRPDVPARAAFEHVLRGACKPGLAEVAVHRDEIHRAFGRAVEGRPRAQARAEERGPRLVLRGGQRRQRCACQ